MLTLGPKRNIGGVKMVFSNRLRGLPLVVGLLGALCSFNSFIEASELVKKFECVGNLSEEGSFGPRSRVVVTGLWSPSEDPALGQPVFAQLTTTWPVLGGDFADDLVFEFVRSESSQSFDGDRMTSGFFRASLLFDEANFILRLPLEMNFWSGGTEFTGDLDYFSNGNHEASAELTCEVF